MWKSLLERWHSQEMIGTFVNYRKTISLMTQEEINDGLSPISRFVMGNIISFIACLYFKVYGPDHWDTCFYSEAAQRVWGKYSNDINGFGFDSEEQKILRILPPELGTQEEAPDGVMRNLTTEKAKMLMDFLGSPEFGQIMFKLYESGYKRHFQAEDNSE